MLEAKPESNLIVARRHEGVTIAGKPGWFGVSPEFIAWSRMGQFVQFMIGSKVVGYAPLRSINHLLNAEEVVLSTVDEIVRTHGRAKLISLYFGGEIGDEEDADTFVDAGNGNNDVMDLDERPISYSNHDIGGHEGDE